MAEQAAFRHDLMGRIYHWLLHHAKYLGTYYTSVSSATLLLKTVPDTDPAPPDEPIVAGGAIAVGNVGPGRSRRPEPPVDAVRNLPVVHPSDATRLVRQEWFDDQPFEIGRFVTALHQAALLFQTSEPAIPKDRYSFMRAKTRVRTHKQDSQRRWIVVHRPPARRHVEWRISSGFRMSGGRCRRIRAGCQGAMTDAFFPGSSL